MNYSLEDRMTSLRAVSIAVLLYILGYSLKISVLLIEILTPVITNEILRSTAAGFTGCALSTALLIVSVNDHNKITPYVIASMDALMLLLVFDIFNCLTIKEIFTSIFISGFMAFIGYQLITVFVTKYQRTKVEFQQSISDLQRMYSEKQRNISKIEQQLSELEQNTCEYCSREFTSKNALNAHKGRCIKKTQNN